MKRLLLSLLLILGVVFSFPGNAFAHGVLTDFALETRSQVQIVATYSTGEPLGQAPVQIFSPNDTSKPWMEGTTDPDGRYVAQFDPSIPGNWKVKIGEYDHGDILTFPMNDQGIEADQISEKPPTTGDNQLIVLGCVAVSGLLGQTLFSGFKKSWGA